MAFRFANYDTPLWVNPNRSGHRFNLPEEAPTQYLSLHPLGCVAEYLRGDDLREPEGTFNRLIRIWAVKVDIESAGVLSFDAADGHGLQAHDLISDDYEPCQAWATGIRQDAGQPRMWLVPSAALPGTDNVVIFGPRVMSPYALTPPDPLIEMPATVIADGSLPPPYLIPDVRYYGDDHGGFEAWTDGVTYVYRDPQQYPLMA